MEEKTLYKLLHFCTTRLSVPGKKGYGTGFFVAPGLILTCAHIVEYAQRTNTLAEAYYNGQTHTTQITRFLPDLDLALLQVDLTNHPCVFLHKEAEPFSQLYSYGYPQNNPKGEPTTFDCEGWTGDQPEQLKFKLGQVRPGMSGSPLLNRQTGGVCGLVQITLDRSSNLGGKAILTKTVLREFSELEALQQEFHQRDRQWLHCLDLQQLRQLGLEAFPLTTETPMAHNLNSMHRVTIGVIPPTHPRTIQQRENVVKDVYAKLTASGTTGIVLTGIGGIGKSTLAALVYRHVEDERQTGQGRFTTEPLWLTIDPAVTMADLAEALLKAFSKEIPHFGNLTPQQQSIALFNALNSTDKARLVILDQFENLLDLQTGHTLNDRPGIGEWLDVLNSQSNHCRVLLTSRIWPRGTHRYAPNCLQAYPIMGLETHEGVELLRKQEVEVRQATEIELQEAVARSDGHPLALTLLASILRSDRSLKLATLLKDPEYTQFWRGEIASSMLDYIYTKQLNKMQRRLLLAFSVYREAVPLYAAQAIISGVSKAQLLTACRVLLAQHLLQASGEGRYQLHAIVADYARDHFKKRSKQANQQSLRNAHARAAQYYLQLAATNCPVRERRQRSSDVHDLIEAIWQYCQAGLCQEAYHLMQQQYIFTDLKRWGGNAILLELFQLLLPLENWHPERSQEALIYSNLGQIHSALGQKELARQDFEKALNIYRELEDRERIGTVLHYLSRADEALGKMEPAQKYGEEALSILRELGDRNGQAMALNDLGHFFWKAGQNEQAQRCFEEALSIYKELKDQAGEGETFRHLGWISRDMGLIYRGPGQKELVRTYYMQARACYEQALTLLREVKYRGEEGRTLNDLGRISMLLGQNELALKYCEEALHILKEVGDRTWEAVVLNNLGRIYTLLGEKEKALSCLKQAWSIRREIEGPWAKGRTLQDIGMLYLKQGHYDVALAFLLLAKNIFYKEQLSRREAAEVQKQIDVLQKEIGDEEFAALLVRVEAQALQIAEQVLHF